MESYIDLLSLLILFSCFIIVASKRVKSYINAFKFQSILIAIAAFILGVERVLKDGYVDILVISIVILALKVIYLPNILNKTYLKVKYKVEKDFFFNIPVLVLICCLLVVFTYFSISSIDGINEGQVNVRIVNSISVVLIGIFFMISRKKVIGQIVGFLVVENGLFVTAMFSNEMPFIVDIGIFIDLITAVFIMSIMVFKISEKFESIDANKLKNLRG